MRINICGDVRSLAGLALCGSGLVAAVVGCSPATTPAVQDDRAGEQVAALAQDVTDNWDEQDSRLNDLESRVEALEQAKASPPVEPGSWIAWESETINTNPRQIILSPRPTQPMYAYASQAECVADAERVAKQNGGNGLTYVRAGSYEATWLVLLRCLPKGTDPR